MRFAAIIGCLLVVNSAAGQRTAHPIVGGWEFRTADAAGDRWSA